MRRRSWAIAAVGLPVGVSGLFIEFVGIEPHTKRLYWRTRRVRHQDRIEDSGDWVANCSYPAPPGEPDRP